MDLKCNGGFEAGGALGDLSKNRGLSNRLFYRVFDSDRRDGKIWKTEVPVPGRISLASTIALALLVAIR